MDTLTVLDVANPASIAFVGYIRDTTYLERAFYVEYNADVSSTNRTPASQPAPKASSIHADYAGHALACSH